MVWRFGTACLVGLAVLATEWVCAQPDAGLVLSPEAVTRAEKAVVYIHVEWKGQAKGGAIQESWGTGFFISETEVLTNHHVIEDALGHPSLRITIRTRSGTRETERYEAYLKASDPDKDLALLTLRSTPAGVSVLALQAEEPLKNSPVLGFGFPMGDIFDPSPQGPGVAVRRGYISRITHQGNTIEADMNIDHGMSGGPALGDSGLVLGMVTAMGGSSDNPNAFAFLISAKALHEFLQEGGSGVEPIATDGGSATATAPLPGEKRLRNYFSLGGALRVHTLVTKLLAEDELEASQSAQAAEAQAADPAATAPPATAPTEAPAPAGGQTPTPKAPAGPDQGMLEVARNNVSGATNYLRELKAPQPLLDIAEKARRVLDEGKDMAQAHSLAVELEAGCDGWVAELPAPIERINYDFGAWLIEMKLGGALILAATDKEYCGKFKAIAELQKAPETVLTALTEIAAALTQMNVERTVTAEKVIARNADALIAVGYLGPATTASRSAEKPATDGASGGREGTNTIRIPTP